MRRLAILTMVSLIAGLAFGGCARRADLAVVADKIVTMESEIPVAEVLLVRDGRVWKIGSRDELEDLVRRAREVLRLQKGQVVYPGFIDAHLHVVGVGRSLKELNLVGTRSLEEVLEKVADAVAKTPPGQWILGRGWDQNDWPVQQFPTKLDLDRVAPDHPVYLRRIGGHVGWANSLALERAGIDADTDDPEGGVIFRLPGSREPSGILVDNAMDLMAHALPQPTVEDLEDFIQTALDHFASLGLTCVHDAGIDSLTYAAYCDLARRGRMKVRVYAMASPGPLLEELLRNGPAIGQYEGMLTVRAVKLFADGALGSRGAALLQPYSDDPGNRGLLVTSPDRIQEITVKCLRGGLQVCTHAIGDRANRLVLDAYERALAEVSVEDHRLRIEHAQVLSPEDIPRFARLGVIASMQPTHATSDMPWAEARLGPERVKGAYAWRSLLDAGARIAGGSDAPVESANPLLGLYAAVTRQDLEGNPPGGWFPEQRLTIEEALRLFTTEAAHAGFLEEELGSLGPDKWADFVVLDRDLASVSPREIPKTKVQLTVVGGRVVYRAR